MSRSEVIILPIFIQEKIHHYGFKKLNQEYLNSIRIIESVNKYDPRDHVANEINNFKIYFRKKKYNYRHLNGLAMNPSGLILIFREHRASLGITIKERYINQFVRYIEIDFAPNLEDYANIEAYNQNVKTLYNSYHQKSYQQAIGIPLPKRYMHSCGY